jgi:hypothetical protein
MANEIKDRVIFDAKVSERKVLLVPVNTLRHTPYNPPSRTKEGKKLTLLVESLKKYGQAYPILITSDRDVIDGNRRLIASKSIGNEFIECIIFDGDKDEVFNTLNTTPVPMGGKGWLVSARKGGKLPPKELAIYNELFALIGSYGIDLLISQNVGLNILPLCKGVCAQGTAKSLDEVIMKTAMHKLSNKLNFIVRSGKSMDKKVKEIDDLLDGING